MWNILIWILIIISPFLISYVSFFLYYYFIKEMRFRHGEYKYIRSWFDFKKNFY